MEGVFHSFPWPVHRVPLFQLLGAAPWVFLWQCSLHNGLRILFPLDALICHLFAVPFPDALGALRSLFTVSSLFSTLCLFARLLSWGCPVSSFFWKIWPLNLGPNRLECISMAVFSFSLTSLTSSIFSWISASKIFSRKQFPQVIFVSWIIGFRLKRNFPCVVCQMTRAYLHLECLKERI